MEIPEFLKDLTAGLAFWEDLYNEEKKNNQAVFKDCAKHLQQLEDDFEELKLQHPDWLHLSPEAEKQFKNNLKQQELLTRLLDRFVVYEAITSKLAQAYLKHSVAQAEARDERLDWMIEGIRKKDIHIAELKKTISHFSDCYTDLLRNYNQLYETLVNIHKPQPN